MYICMYRNSFGRCIYANFSKILREVRFTSLRNGYIEAQGGLQSLLLDECKMTESKYHVPVSKKDIGKRIRMHVYIYI
jgi:hypothetical protein